MNPLEMIPCKGGLTLERDPHKACYAKLETYILDLDLEETFTSGEDYQESLETDTMWTLHFYPDTPIGSYKISGPTLERVLMHAARILGE